MSSLSGHKLILVLIAALAIGIAPLFLRWGLPEVLLSLMLFSGVMIGIVENLRRERSRGKVPGGAPGWLSFRTLAYGALMFFCLCVIVSAALSRG